MVRFLIQIIIMSLILFILKKFTKDNARVKGELRILQYGKVFKLFIILFDILVFLPIFFILISKTTHQWSVTVFFTIWVLSFTSLLTYFTFFIKTSYDNNYIYYSGIKKKNKKISWENLKELKPPRFIPCYTLVFNDFKIYHFPTLDGGKELRDFILKDKLFKQ